MNQPPETSSGAPPPRPSYRTFLIALAFWAAGMLMAHGPMIRSGLGRVQGDLGDPRLMHYMLEHGYRWITGDPLHRSYWDPPVFYPARNTAATSETILGAAPIYWLWRAIGVPVDTAYPLWILAISSLNYLATFFLLRRALGRSAFAAGFGASLFSFASLRMAQLGHPQLLPAFYFVLVVYALLRMFQQPDARQGARWIALFAVALVGQFYTCFYVAWFLAFALGIALSWAFLLPSLRPQALPALRRHGIGLAIAGLAVGVALLPLIIHSLRAASEIGYRGYDEAEVYLPRAQSWLYFGPDHWLYGWMSGFWPFTQIPARIFEHALGLGALTWVLAILGLWNLRRTPLGRILVAVSLTLLACTLMIPGGASVWGLIYLLVPGAKAIRAVARVSLVLLLPASAGAASFLDESRWKKPLLIAAALFSLLEQGRSSPSFDRREIRDATKALARRVDPACEAFFYTASEAPRSGAFLNSLPSRFHADALMASLEAGVPTVNGYSGGSPPGWPFEGSTLSGDEREIERELQDWCRSKGLDRRRIQWLRGAR